MSGFKRNFKPIQHSITLNVGFCRVKECVAKSAFSNSDGSLFISRGWAEIAQTELVT